MQRGLHANFPPGVPQPAGRQETASGAPGKERIGARLITGADNPSDLVGVGLRA